MSETADGAFAEFHEELRSVARAQLAAGGPGAGWPSFAASGWLGLEADEPFGGAGATLAETAVLLEELGRAASPAPYLGSVVLAGGVLALLAPSSGRDDLLRATVAGATRATLVAGQAADHALPALVPFHLQQAGEGLRLHGAAGFVPDVVGADRLLVLATQPDGTPVVVALEPDAAGLEVAAQPALDATRSLAEVTASEVPVGSDQVWTFAGEPEPAVRHLGDRAAVAVACDSLGLGEAMLAATVAYVAERKQFGRAIGSFQAVKHACADMLVQLTVGRELVHAAVEALVAGDPDADRAVSMAKAHVGAAAVDVVGAAVQLHGGIGYTWESGIHVYLKRAVLNRSLFGTPAAHRRRTALRYLTT